MTQIPQQYGQALYTLAREEGISRQVMDQMKVLSEAFLAEPDFLRLLASVRLSKQTRCGLVNDSFEKMLHPYLLRFLNLLIQEGIIAKFPDCCKYFEDCYFAEYGILPVQVYTAQALTPMQISRLTKKMESITGKTVLLQQHTDLSCLGGMRICYEGKQVDGTVKNRLQGIAEQLKNTIL